MNIMDVVNGKVDAKKTVLEMLGKMNPAQKQTMLSRFEDMAKQYGIADVFNSEVRPHLK